MPISSAILRIARSSSGRFRREVVLEVVVQLDPVEPGVLGQPAGIRASDIREG